MKELTESKDIYFYLSTIHVEMKNYKESTIEQLSNNIKSWLLKE